MLSLNPFFDEQPRIVRGGSVPSIFWIHRPDSSIHNLWGGTISNGTITTGMVLAGTGNASTGLGTVPEVGGIAPVDIEGVRWIYFTDRVFSPNNIILKRVRADGTGLETLIASVTVAIGATAQVPLAIAVDPLTLTTYMVIRHGTNSVSLYSFTSAGVATQRKTFTSSAYQYGFMQFDATNSQLAISRGDAVDAIEIYNISNFATPAQTIPASTQTQGSSTAHGAPFVLTADKMYYQSAYARYARRSRPGYALDSPNPWVDLAPNFAAQAGVIAVGSNVYGVVGTEEALTVSKLINITASGAGTEVPGWPDAREPGALEWGYGLSPV